MLLNILGEIRFILLKTNHFPVAKKSIKRS